MEKSDHKSKVLSTELKGLPTEQEHTKLQKMLDQRMSLSEALDATGRIVGCYPHTGDAGESYIGALADVLQAYPKSVAEACADRVRGIPRECKFLPTVSDIVAWCEKKTEPLRLRFDRNLRIFKQLADREEYLRMEAGAKPARAGRLTLTELKEKYGDWMDEWRPLGLSIREKRQAAREMLIAEIGEFEFDSLPDAAE